MIGYRTIGVSEFRSLIKNKQVNGIFDSSTCKMNTANDKDVVCFFNEKYAFWDKDHKIFIKVDISNILKISKGYYIRPLSWNKYRIANNRPGTTSYCLDEFLVNSYKIEDVKEIYIDKISKKDLELLTELSKVYNFKVGNIREEFYTYFKKEH